MAKWLCPAKGCQQYALAPSVRPVHALAANPSLQTKDPHCPVHYCDLIWTPDETDLPKPQPQKVAQHPGWSLYGEVLTVYDIKEQPSIRRTVADLMDIVDKGHATHGANFSSPQSLAQIIDNLFSKVQGGKADTAAEAIIRAYGYDPRTKGMAKTG